MKRTRTLVGLAAAIAFLAGCAADDASEREDASAPSSEVRSADASAADESAQQGLLARHGLERLDSTQIVNALDRMPVAERPERLLASVRSDAVVLAEGTEEVTLPLPEDRFYLSVAPYLAQTHPCTDHALTSCRGELGARDVEVEVTSDDGTSLLEAERRTFDNGFVGLWLPRGVTGQVTVRYDDRTGSAPFSTHDGSPTCLTTLQLA